MSHPTVVPLSADITKLAVDAIVNAANTALSVGGGVDAAIHEAAGEHGLAAACAELGGCETGDAKATPGFGLPARWIIHAVGPVWQGGQHGEAELLASCYRRAIEVAEDLEARTVALPAISTGIYGFPRELAAQTAVTTLLGVDTTVQRVILVAFDEDTLELYERFVDGTAGS
ncbi:MAG: O-acetyl-ADP-ribose deacetylase [Acidimicrobiales bacterium]